MLCLIVNDLCFSPSLAITGIDGPLDLLVQLRLYLYDTNCGVGLVPDKSSKLGGEKIDQLLIS